MSNAENRMTLSLRLDARFAAWRGNCARRMPDLACRLSWEKKVMCASFAPDKDNTPGKLVLKDKYFAQMNLSKNLS